MPARRAPTRLRNPPLERPVFETTPKVVGLQITGRCQLHCRHCFNRSGPRNSQELPLGIIERLLDDLLEWRVDELRISGGEPTFHRQFRDIVEACRQRGIRIAINTHGVYSSTLLAYAESAPIDLFLVSVDGLRESNDAIRGQGTFARAIETCRRLRRAGQPVIISSHVGADNRDDVVELIHLAAEIGADFKVSPIRPVGRAVRELADRLIQPADYLDLVRKVTALRRRYPHIRLLTDFDVLDNGVSAGDCERDPGRRSCKAGRSMISINYDGKIYPCAFFMSPADEFSAGSLYDDSLTDVWRSSPIFRPFRIHRKSEFCQSCVHYQRQCAGGCPAVAHATTGYLDAHDPTCFVDLVPLSGQEAT
jgi:radical SAM protein with 4Fe4S-binding SPASM domain